MKNKLLLTFNRVAESAVGGGKCANTPPHLVRVTSCRVIAVIFMFCMLGIGSMWAADWSWTQDYEYIDKNGSVVSSEQTYHSAYADWVRYKACSRWNDSKKDFYYDTDGSTQLRGLYLTHDGGNQGFYKCVLPEGGIKSVSFKWRQRNADDDGKRLRLRIYINDAEINAERITANGSEAKRTANSSYTSTSALCTKTSGEVTFKVLNDATESKEALTSVPGTVIIGPITITQYLRYMQKSVTIGLPNKGYINRNLIDNTDDTQNIRYSIHDKNAETTLVADIDELTGAITPKAAGTAIVTASWEGVTTTYELTVDPNIYVESFSQNASYAESSSAEKSWDSDVSDIIPSWEAYLTMRTESDTIGGTYVHGTYLGTTSDAQGYLKTSGAVEGGVKELSFDWKQGRAGTGCTLTLAMYLGGETKVCEDSKTGTNASPGTDIWNYNYDGTISVQANSVLEIKNTSIVGSKNPRVILSAIKITPYLLYYDRDVEWDRTSDSGDSYKNEGWINHTSNDADITYGISDNEINAEVDDEGKVTSEGGGDVTITATWKSVTTSYNLHIKAKTTASFAQSVVSVGLDGSVSNTLNETTGYSGSISYGSDNTSVATVNPTTGVVTIVGVGQTTITATLAGNDDYSATTASYNLYVTDNSANVLVETFENVSQEDLTNDTIPWSGKLFDWRVFQVRRNSTDTIRISEQGTWIRIHNAKRGFMQSEDVVEGGIKHISFYWRQWAAESDQTLRLAVLVGEKPAEATRIEKMERSCESGNASALHEKYLFGASNVMRSNQKLVIRNESFTGEAYAESSTREGNSVSRLIIDDIHITPWLLYTRKSVSIAVDGDPYTNTALINTTAGETGILSYRSLNETVATVNGSGVVTPHAIGVTTIEAKFDWGGGNYVTTTYDLHVVSALTWTEDYSQAERHSYDQIEKNYTGNYGFSWTYRKISTHANQIVNNNQAIWMSRDENDNECFIELAEAEGGIKTLDCDWQQANMSDNDKQLWLQILLNDAHKGNLIKETGSSAYYDSYTHVTKNFTGDLLCKTNAKLKLLNKSVKGGTGTDKDDRIKGRIKVGPITITPYLFYLEREKTLNAGDRYIHPMIDNMDGEGTVTYSLVPEDSRVASIDPKTGEVTAQHGGDVTVKATWTEGAYTTYVLHVQAIVLNNEADNTSTINTYHNHEVDVQLADRTIRTGGYNTLCLPFAVSEEQLQATLPGAKAYEFTNAYLSETNLDIRFDKRTALEAGKPYLVTVPADVENPVFESVTIDASSAAYNTIEGENMRFIGSFNAGDMNETGLYVVANNLYRVESASDQTIGACRAYFDVLAGEPALGPVRMRIVAGTNTATGIDEVNSEELRVKKMLINGQIFIIREGKMYNAQGQAVK